MSDYDTDLLIWSEHQADLLRRLAAGEPMNETPDSKPKPRFCVCGLRWKNLKTFETTTSLIPK